MIPRHDTIHLNTRPSAARRGLRAWEVAAILGLTLGSAARLTAADIPLPAGETIATVSSGEGTGTLTVKDGRLSIAATAATDGATFDFMLGEKPAIPADADRISLFVGNVTGGGSLRVLVQDSRGGIWAVSTVLQGGSPIPNTKNFKRVLTYAFDITEIGFVDGSVMVALDPKTYDEYDPPRPPLRLAGFRVGMGKGTTALEIANISPMTKGVKPDPYWDLAGGFSWGPEEPEPFVRANDLGLGKGAYHYTLEILSTDEREVLVSGRGDLTVAAPEDPIVFPLLARGAYLLRLHMVETGTAVPAGKTIEGKDWSQRLLIMRNSRGAQAVGSSPQCPRLPLLLPKYLSLSLDANRADRQYHPVLTTRDAAGGEIVWKVESQDKRPLLDGRAPAGQPVALDLSAAAQEESVLFFSAKLVKDGRVIDTLARILAVAAPVAPKPAAATGPVTFKMKALDGKFKRFKGDWTEGSTPIVTRHEANMKLFERWFDDANKTGYNIVELSAPWYDLEPVQGVYQFKYLDKLIRRAEEKGFFVTLKVSPCHKPAWAPGEPQMDQRGLVHGTWHGGSLLTLTPASAEFSQAYFRFLEALADHYRDNPKVLGYNLLGLLADHVYLDHPWQGQFVDYSESMRLSFVEFLKGKYGDLKSCGMAHGRDYPSWDAVTLPDVQISMDANGRPRPRTDALGRDYSENKLRTYLNFKLGAIHAVRRGDPACAPMPQHDNCFSLAGPELDKIPGMYVPWGSMDSAVPFEPLSSPFRVEPWDKICLDPKRTDEGLSNVLFYSPDRNGFHNYWMPEWNLDNVTKSKGPLVKAAEERLAVWFRAADRMAGAAYVGASVNEKKGVELTSTETQLMVWQHLHMWRFYDFVQPFFDMAGKDGTRVDQVYTAELTAEAAARRPYIYVPYASDTLTTAQVDMLDAYVEAGGKLILEPSSGQWSPDSAESNILGRKLGLPEARSLPLITAESTPATVRAGLLEGLNLSFRTGKFPPVWNRETRSIYMAAKCYLRLYELKTPPAGAQVLADLDGRPAAYLMKKGKGEILVFCAGVVEWYKVPGLTLRINNWALGKDLQAPPPPKPDILASPLKKDGVLFMLGRRIKADAKPKDGQVPADAKPTMTCAVKFPHAADRDYTVTDLLSEKDLGAFPGSVLKEKGLVMELRPGEGFCLEAKEK